MKNRVPEVSDLPNDSGHGPRFEIEDLPSPPPFNSRNLFRVIGPGAILLATAIGGGEWLIGPAQAVGKGVELLWIVPLAILFQLVFNLEAIRYTLYTGEPIYGGIIRLWPGPRAWGPFYCVLAFLQLCWPALALLCANTLFSAVFEKLPDEAGPDAAFTAKLFAVGLVLVVLAILHFGGTVERMLERASWFMLAFIFTFLTVVNVWFVPFPHWIATLKGFLGFHLPDTLRQLTGGAGRPGGVQDWAILGALASTAGTGGIGNLTITNWMRDKGFAMGSLTGAIPSAVGSRELRLSRTGKVFPASGENLERWREWKRYVLADQVLVWALFCFLGMFLNVNLATAIIPAGTNITGLSAGAYQARYMAEHLWHGFWYLTLINGFWILFSTQLGNTDILVRTITDVLWLSSERARAWRGGDIRGIYYATLFGVSAFALGAMWWARAAEMFKVLANMAGLVLAVASVQILVVNRRFLPRGVRPALWQECLLLLCAVFYGIFTVQWIRTLLP